jgi:ABC-type iron transport system FetAB permease component
LRRRRFLVIVALVTFIFSLDHMLLFLAVLLTFGIIAEIVVQMHYRHELVEMIEMTLGY